MVLDCEYLRSPITETIMHDTSVLRSLLIYATLALATVPLSSVKRLTNLPLVPNKFIVEVDTSAHIPTKRGLTVATSGIYINNVLTQYSFIGPRVTLCIS